MKEREKLCLCDYQFGKCFIDFFFFYKTFYKFYRKFYDLTEKFIKIDQGLITKQIIENTENICQKTFYYKTNEALVENILQYLKRKLLLNY